MGRQVTFTPNESDYIAAARAWFLEALRRPRTLYVFVVVIFAGVGLAVFMAPAGPLSSDDFPELTAWALYPLLLMTVLYAITYALIPRRTRRLWKQQSALHGPVTFRWSDDGFEMVVPKGRSKLDWADVHKTFATDQMYIFYLHDKAYYYLPRATLAPDDDADLARITASVGKHFRPRL